MARFVVLMLLLLLIIVSTGHMRFTTDHPRGLHAQMSDHLAGDRLTDELMKGCPVETVEMIEGVLQVVHGVGGVAVL
jgi:hypothetical protein